MYGTFYMLNQIHVSTTVCRNFVQKHLNTSIRSKSILKNLTYYLDNYQFNKPLGFS